MTPLLNVTDLKTWFPIRRGLFSRTTGHIRAVDGVSLHLNPGETLGLVGESGCGKSTLARTILRLDAAHEGAVHFEGTDLLQLSKQEMRLVRPRLQMIFQDPYASMNPRQTVRDLLLEAPAFHRRITRAEHETVAVRLLQDVGMDRDALNRYPHEFSGGQRQRICIARALALQPSLIACDEIVSALDVSVQAQVLNLMADLQEKYRLAYLFISHDLSVVRHLAQRTAVMYLGKIVESGPTIDVIQNPRHPYTRALVSAVPRLEENQAPRIILAGDPPSAAHLPSGCRFHPRCPYARAECTKTEPVLEAVDAETSVHQVACWRHREI
jgi:oligopeptide/dipeptide ABC transporter ATP-binding protein